MKLTKKQIEQLDADLSEHFFDTPWNERKYSEQPLLKKYGLFALSFNVHLACEFHNSSTAIPYTDNLKIYNSMAKLIAIHLTNESDN